ncbi:MAG TPA: hypothetical protein VLJ37_00575 [bacterium]|nr:hypothetical protein [bacterium]
MYKKRLFVVIIIILAFTPWASFAENPDVSVGSSVGKVFAGARPYLLPKSINIPTITCRLVTVPVGTTEVQAHACLVDLPMGSTLTGVVAYRRAGMEINDELESEITLYEMKVGSDSANEVGSFVLKSKDTSEQSSFSAVKSETNSFVVWISDIDGRLAAASPMPVPGESPPPPLSKPYQLGRSGVQMVSVKYK